MKSSSAVRDLFSLLTHSKNYFGAQVYFVFLNLLSIPIFSKLYSTEEYGILTVYFTYSTIFAIVLSLNSFRAVGRYYYEQTDDFPEFMGTLLIFTSGVYATTTFIFFLSIPWTGKILNLGTTLPFLLSISGLNYIAESIYTQILLAQKKSREYSILQIIKNTLVTFLSIYFVYILSEERYYGQILPTMAIGLALLLYSLFRMRRTIKFSFRKTHVIYIIKYTLPLLPYTLSSFILARFDRILIAGLIGNSEAGIYSMGYNIGNLIIMVITAIEAALIPNFYAFVKSENFKSLDRLVQNSLKLILVGALGLILIKSEVFYFLVDDKFTQAVVIVLPVVLANIFWAIFLFNKMYFEYHKFNFSLSVLSFLGGTVNIIANLILIPMYGILGGGYATIISFFFIAIGSRMFLNMKSELPLYKITNVIQSLIIFFAFTIFSFWISIDEFTIGLMTLVIKGLIIISLLVILFIREVYQYLRKGHQGEK